MPESKHFNQLNPDEAERLAILAEECGEVIQAIGKILRHGYEEYSPKDPFKISNRSNLERELGDIKYITTLMINNEDVDEELINEYCVTKALRIIPYLHHHDDSD